MLLLQALLWLPLGLRVDDPRLVYDAAAKPHFVASSSIHGIVTAAAVDAVWGGWRSGRRMTGEFRVGLRCVAMAGAGALVMIAFEGAFFAASLHAGAPLLGEGRTSSCPWH